MEKPSKIADSWRTQPRERKRTLPSMVGTTQGLLTIKDERRIKSGLGKSVFEVHVVCVCGKDKWVDERSVRRGQSTSCGGCANKTHGKSRTPEYAVWRSVMARCDNPNHKAYNNYGGRGVRVCQEWYDFNVFFADMGKQPFKGASIDRTDNAKGYTKENCRWANAVEQSNNRRTNRVLTITGISMTIAEWAQKTGIRHNTISYRLAHGWNPEDAVSVRPNFTNRGCKND